MGWIQAMGRLMTTKKYYVTPSRYHIPWSSPSAFCHCLSSFYHRKQCLHPLSKGRGNVVVLARYVLASLQSGEGERFAVNMLAICRRKVMGPLTHLVFVFSGLQWNAMGSDEGRMEQLTSLRRHLICFLGGVWISSQPTNPPLRV